MNQGKLVVKPEMARVNVDILKEENQNLNLCILVTKPYPLHYSAACKKIKACDVKHFYNLQFIFKKYYY